MAGQPKIIKSGEELVQYYREFCAEVVELEYTIAPTMTEFGQWLARRLGRDTVDRKTIYNTINEYFPTIKSEVEGIRSDVMAQGMMTGKYHATATIFALKNWCGWADRREIKTEQTVNLSQAVADVERLVNGDS